MASCRRNDRVSGAGPVVDAFGCRDADAAFIAACSPDYIAKLVRVAMAAEAWAKIRHRSVMDDEPLYRAVAALKDHHEP